jgi:homocysteine S-methyltransferase
MLNNRDPEKIQVPRKKFWISSAWPRGVHPQMDKKGEHVRTEEVWRVMSEEREGLEKPFGIGVNCTGPEFVRKIVTELTDVARRSAEDHREREEQELKKLAFVLYPDGGSVYDVVTRTWTERTTEPSLWAKSLMSVAKELEESGVWEQIIIGGCCKAGFEEIRSLRAEL